jgi:hypothetical protein
VLGIISRKATPGGALYTVIFGAAAGIVLNSFPSVFTWEAATLIETALCLVIFYGSSLKQMKDVKYKERVVALFTRLNNKCTDITMIDANFQRALSTLYAVSLGISGVLFVAMGLPAIATLSGVLSVLSGLVCFLTGIVLWLSPKRIVKNSN